MGDMGVRYPNLKEAEDKLTVMTVEERQRKETVKDKFI